MDISQIKQTLGKLSFIKNYSAFILPVILLVVFLILQFAFGTFMSRNLKDDIARQSIQKGKKIRSLSSQDISSRQFEEEKKYMDAFEADVNKILNLVRQTSQRELLDYKIFPEPPKDASVLIFKEFGKNYRRAIEDLLEKYGARERPTDIEIKKAIEQSSSPASARSRSTGYMDMPSISGSPDFSFERLDSLGRKIVNYLCEATAKKASFYANAADIAGYEFWDNVSVPTDRDRSSRTQEYYQYKSIEHSVWDCWFWQIGYWIIEDVFKTISAMNSNCNNVLDCPVKRLLAVSFRSLGYGRSRSEFSNRPGYITKDNPGFIPSFTNHKSDENLDVVHFEFSVIIESESILGFMEELCSEKEHVFRGWTGRQPPQTFRHNQITILRSSTLPVDKSSKEHEFHRYGDDAVVKLGLTCEYIFERQGYKYQDSNGEEKTIMPNFIWNREKIEEDRGY